MAQDDRIKRPESEVASKMVAGVHSAFSMPMPRKPLPAAPASKVIGKAMNKGKRKPKPWDLPTWY